MQYENYAALANSINAYDDIVLSEAKQFALAICAHNDNYCTDALFDAINDSAIELGRDAVQTCWQHTQLRECIDLYNDEQAFDALHELCAAMLMRSYAVQVAFN